MRLSALALLALATPAHAAGPSFDCARAGTPTEFAICDNAALSELDLALAEAFRTARDRPGVKDRQRAWIGERNLCGANVDCLEQRMQDRLAELAGPPAIPGFATPPTPSTGDRSGAYCPDPGTGFGFAQAGDRATISYAAFLANGHACGTGPLSATREGAAWVNRDGGCTVTVTLTATGFHITATPQDTCQALYCGARAVISDTDIPFTSRSPVVRDPANWSFMEQGC